MVQRWNATLAVNSISIYTACPCALLNFLFFLTCQQMDLPAPYWLLKLLEEEIQNTNRPPLTGCSSPGPSARSLLGLPARLGGLGNRDPSKKGAEQLQMSQEVTKPNVRLLLEQHDENQSCDFSLSSMMETPKHVFRKLWLSNTWQSSVPSGKKQRKSKLGTVLLWTSYPNPCAQPLTGPTTMGHHPGSLLDPFSSMDLRCIKAHFEMQSPSTTDGKRLICRRTVPAGSLSTATTPWPATRVDLPSLGITRAATSPPTCWTKSAAVQMLRSRQSCSPARSFCTQAPTETQSSAWRQSPRILGRSIQLRIIRCPGFQPSLERCRPIHSTDVLPSWDEQTPHIRTARSRRWDVDVHTARVFCFWRLRPFSPSHLKEDSLTPGQLNGHCHTRPSWPS